LEKAQLLASSSEIGSNTEMRIREAIAAYDSLRKAEIIVEKEFRETAESAMKIFAVNTLCAILLTE